MFIESFGVNLSNLSITLNRTSESPPTHDILKLGEPQNNQPQPTPEEVLWFQQAIKQKFHIFDPSRHAIGAVTPEQQAYQAMHQETLDRLERLNERLTAETHQYRITCDSDFTEKVAQLEQKYTDLRDQLSTEHTTKLDDLTKKSSELDELRKKLDDRSNTHARREIRRDILDEIQKRTERFELTKSTRNLRWPIAALNIIACLFLGGLAVWLAMSASGNDPLLVARQMLMAGGAVGFLVYLIRWYNRWFEQHAQAEFHLKQFQLDIERASWIVETTLEWNDAKGTTIPDKLLESLSRNLFIDKSQPPEQVTHPADQLASALLGTASSIKLKPGDSELTINPKNLKKASQN